jgi:hypothetical protein
LDRDAARVFTAISIPVPVIVVLGSSTGTTNARMLSVYRYLVVRTYKVLVMNAYGRRKVLKGLKGVKR